MYIQQILLGKHQVIESSSFIGRVKLNQTLCAQIYLVTLAFLQPNLTSFMFGFVKLSLILKV
jgi:hypothetical protein